MAFERNVFINCPFDRKYEPVLKAIIFTVLYLGFEPQISATASSAHLRITEIMRLIRDSKYSIHDISRCEPLKSGELPRFNMPYEMGLDIGCASFGNAQMRSKRCLILEEIKNRYDAVISDISGQDIKEHSNKPKRAIEKVLDWFTTNGAIPINQVPGLSVTWAKYQECIVKMNAAMSELGYSKADIRRLNTAQYINAIRSAF